MRNKKDILNKIFAILSIVLVGVCIVALIFDYVNYNEYGSAPFYVNIIIRGLEFLLPAIICLLISYFLNKRK